MNQQGMSIITDDERRLVDETVEVGFIPAFEAWAGKKTDAPEYTLRAAALVALSLAAGDTVVLPAFTGKTVYLNIYVLIVGPSTTMRKSTVLGMVDDLLPTSYQTGVPYITTMDDVSIQAFNKVAAKQGMVMAPVLLAIDEVAGIFQVARNAKGSYLSGFDKTLLKAYDHSAITIHRTQEEVVAPLGAFVSLFAASTPEPLMDVLDLDDVASGLLPRFIIFDAQDAVRGKRRSMQERLDVQAEWEEEAEGLKAMLAGIAVDRCAGLPSGTTEDGSGSTFKTREMKFTEEALERLSAMELWGEGDQADSSNWRAIKGRGYWHIVKLSGLFALSRAGVTATVELIDVLRAAHLVETTLGDLGAMQETVGANKMERTLNEIMGLVALSGSKGAAVSSVASKLKLTWREMQDYGSTLKVRGLIEMTEDARWRKL